MRDWRSGQRWPVILGIGIIEANILSFKWTLTFDSFKTGIPILSDSGNRPRMKWLSFLLMMDLNGSIDPVTHQSRRSSRALLCNVDCEDGILKNGQQTAQPPSIHGIPTIHPFWAAGFSFSRGHFVVQIPYDQHLPQVFQGEEMGMALRGFSYGYDYFAPERNTCFHMYALNEYRENRMSVPRFSENKKSFRGVADGAMKRLISILRMNINDDNKSESFNRLEEDKYGIGSARQLTTFFSTFGIDMERKTMENHLCWFVGEKMQSNFLPALRDNGTDRKSVV